MRYHHFPTHTCVLPRYDVTENNLKKCFLSNIARKGGGALPPQPAVVYFSKQMHFLAWQMGRWFTKSDNRDVDGEVQTFLPTLFFRNIYFRKMKTDKYQVWFYHGSDKPWSDHICRSRAAGWLLGSPLFLAVAWSTFEMFIIVIVGKSKMFTPIGKMGSSFICNILSPKYS